MKDFKPHEANGYSREWKKNFYFFDPSTISQKGNNPMWLTDFTETEEEENMHGLYAHANLIPAPPIPKEDEVTPEMQSVANMVGYIPTAKDLVNDEVKERISLEKGVAIPTKYVPKGSHWCESEGWISPWRFETRFEEVYPVQWDGFESNTKELVDMGWTITLEYNRATGRRKLCLRNAASGLLTRVPFEFNMPYIDVPKLFAVRNYRMKAAKFTEFVAQLTEDMIPELLDYIREVKKAKVSDFVCAQKQQEAASKVIELGNYLHNQQPREAA